MQIKLQILDVEFDFDGCEISLDEQKELTDGTIGSYIDVVKTYPDESLEELACDYLSDMQGWLVKDIKVVWVKSYELSLTEGEMQALAACLITHEVDEVPTEYQEGFVCLQKQVEMELEYA